MKSLALLLVLVASVAGVAHAGDKKIKITTVPANAEIWINGQQVAAGAMEIKVPDGLSVQVEVRAFGYVAQSRTYVNNRTTNLPSKDQFVLVKDPSIDGSSSTDLANRDVDVQTARSEEEAWRLISQIVTGAFDVIEVTDRNSGYLRTAWTLKRFDPGASVRTRLIVKLGSSDPLVYRVKLVSEWAPAGTSSRDDEKWSEWDRLLRTYLNLIPEMQSRLSGTDK